jgi:hypothetical protein
LHEIIGARQGHTVIWDLLFDGFRFRHGLNHPDGLWEGIIAPGTLSRTVSAHGWYGRKAIRGKTVCEKPRDQARFNWRARIIILS